MNIYFILIMILCYNIRFMGISRKSDPVGTDNPLEN